MNGSTEAAEDIPAKGSAAMKPASSAGSKYRSQYADVNQDACGAGGCLILQFHLHKSAQQGCLAIEQAKEASCAVAA